MLVIIRLSALCFAALLTAGCSEVQAQSLFCGALPPANAAPSAAIFVDTDGAPSGRDAVHVALCDAGHRCRKLVTTHDQRLLAIARAPGGKVEVITASRDLAIADRDKAVITQIPESSFKTRVRSAINSGAAVLDYSNAMCRADADYKF
ncbi:hypothetical protein P7B02_03320 [Caulobacter segnis]|uniref:hypothetical protein n=1 Tax=Caulobacter segnis TaxID=88688 RepID=UPI00240FBFBE|nr:hypothetical protein [Caulobacter segnis]MDG2520561.1 hypothetical protein [Caulobacter segnis]